MFKMDMLFSLSESLLSVRDPLDEARRDRGCSM